MKKHHQWKSPFSSTKALVSESGVFPGSEEKILFLDKRSSSFHEKHKKGRNHDLRSVRIISPSFVKTRFKEKTSLCKNRVSSGRARLTRKKVDSPTIGAPRGDGSISTISTKKGESSQKTSPSIVEEDTRHEGVG